MFVEKLGSSVFDFAMQHKHSTHCKRSARKGDRSRAVEDFINDQKTGSIKTFRCLTRLVSNKTQFEKSRRVRQLNVK